MISSMIITNAKYVKDFIREEICAVNCIANGEDVSVPLDPANRHYAEILRQVEAGTLTIADAD
jgi:hypothetical protein|tara:strand:+ start:513 stop:701 length:189 start_codon:yes stop_codon:yes gene_type:complete